jgi:hypothetical protein
LKASRLRVASVDVAEDEAEVPRFARDENAIEDDRISLMIFWFIRGNPCNQWLNVFLERYPQVAVLNSPPTVERAV